MKKLIMMICFCGILACFSVSAYAAESDEDQIEYESVNSILSRFDLSVEDILNGEQDELEEISAIDEFVFSSGFNSLDVTTFSAEKTCIGQGVKGMTVGVVVFQENDGTYDTIFSSVKTLGASGTYNEKLYFKPVSKQLVTFIVKSDDKVGFITYDVKTVEESTKEILENIELDFSKETSRSIEEDVDLSSSNNGTKNTDAESFMDMFGIKQEIEF